ncbi:hypothetical protein SCHPADRAFT_998120 [Schizopora paradoxa]|uniref:Uncharacterized protein n=1 Tax=Schizopora paradoxa TaxID=27342 RepID=A0A0H2RKF0_9AGAM|nr:hypothetical protein SCHPADRAFT_998120 [Schizopora paradoxa]
MDDNDHIIWQSSQPKCEALTVLMSKAQQPNASALIMQMPRQSSNVHRHKEQTTALDAQDWQRYYEFESSQSSSSSSSSYVPASSSLSSSSLRTRKTKRRRLASESSFESQSDSFTPTPQSQLASPSKLISMIRSASQSVEEISEMKRKSFERARQKAKLKGKERKKPPTQARVVESEHLLDRLRKRESEAARSFKVAKGKGREEARVTPKYPDESSAMDVDEDTARMPPPQHLPTRFAPPDRKDTRDRERGRGDSSSSADSSSMSGSSSSTVSSSQSNSSSTHRSFQSNSSTTSVESIPSPPRQKKLAAIPILPPNLTTPEQFHPQPSSSQKAKTRVLGMRRYATSPSNSQQAVTPAPVGAPLPTKQKQFKPPLTKRSASFLASIQAAVATPNVALEKPIPPPAGQPFAKPVKTPSVAQPPAKSSSAPSKPNDSFDSMEMDLDELWTACSAYD